MGYVDDARGVSTRLLRRLSKYFWIKLSSIFQSKVQNQRDVDFIFLILFTNYYQNTILLPHIQLHLNLPF